MVSIPAATIIAWYLAAARADCSPAKMAMIRVSMKVAGAPPHIFNVLVQRDAFDADFEAAMRLQTPPPTRALTEP